MPSQQPQPQRSKPLTADQQLQIIQLSQDGLSGRKIADQLGVSYKAVRGVLENRPDTGSNSFQQFRPSKPAARPTSPLFLPAGEVEVIEVNPKSQPPAPIYSERQAKLRQAKADFKQTRSADREGQEQGQGDSQPRQMVLNPPPANIFDIENGMRWIQQQTSQMWQDNEDPRLRVFLLDKMLELNAQAASHLESIYNIKLLDAFIQAVSAILERFEPEVRRVIYDELESRGVAEGAISVVFNGQDGGG